MPEPKDLDDRLAFRREDVDVIERHTTYDGFFRMDVLRLRHRLFEGGWSDAMRRELFVRGPAVVLLPYDAARDEVVMIEQFRVGSLEFGPSPWQFEFVAGIAEPGEDAEAVARREAMEEAGLEIGRMRHLHHYQVSPGGNTEEIIVYLGEADTGAAGGVHGLDAEHEDIRVHRVRLDDALAALEAGQVRNAAGIIGLQWLALHRDEVRACWSSPPVPGPATEA